MDSGDRGLEMRGYLEVKFWFKNRSVFGNKEGLESVFRRLEIIRLKSVYILPCEWLMIFYFL